MSWRRCKLLSTCSWEISSFFFLIPQYRFQNPFSFYRIFCYASFFLTHAYRPSAVICYPPPRKLIPHSLSKCGIVTCRAVSQMLGMLGRVLRQGDGRQAVRSACIGGGSFSLGVLGYASSQGGYVVYVVVVIQLTLRGLVAQPLKSWGSASAALVLDPEGAQACSFALDLSTLCRAGCGQPRSCLSGVLILSLHLLGGSRRAVWQVLNSLFHRCESTLQVLYHDPHDEPQDKLRRMRSLKRAG